MPYDREDPAGDHVRGLANLFEDFSKPFESEKSRYDQYNYAQGGTDRIRNYFSQKYGVLQEKGIGDPDGKEDYQEYQLKSIPKPVFAGQVIPPGITAVMVRFKIVTNSCRA